MQARKARRSAIHATKAANTDRVALRNRWRGRRRRHTDREPVLHRCGEADAAITAFDKRGQNGPELLELARRQGLEQDVVHRTLKGGKLGELALAVLRHAQLDAAAIGGIGLISTLIALLIATAMGDALTISGFMAWVLAALLVWVITALGGWAVMAWWMKKRVAARRDSADG